MGGAAIAFALVAYPLVGMAFGHTYPSAPLFGVFPCPTAIFTLGVFLCCTRPRVYELLVPLVWCFFGTMAAVYMGIYQDFGLTTTAGLTIVGLGMVRAERCRAGQLPAEQQQGPAQSRPAPKLAAVGR